MYGYIYKIENIANGKIYIGQTTMNPDKREYHHFYDLRNKKHTNSHLQNSFNKYGESSFIFHVLNYATSKEALDEVEIGYIELYDCLKRNKGYNLQTGGSNGKHSKESKKKMSENHPDVSGKNNPMFGKTFSEETRRKMSEAKIGKYCGGNNPMFGRQRGKYRGTHYSIKTQNPWTRVWNTTIAYNKKYKSLGVFNDPISGEIVFNFVFKEIYGE